MVPIAGHEHQLNVNSIVRSLAARANQWIKLAYVLKVPQTVVDGIVVSRLQDNEESLRRVVEWWFKNTPNPEWIDIEQALKGRSCIFQKV